MASWNTFEDIEAWQEARVLSKCVYDMTRECRDRSLCDQIQRAGVSVMSNIAEGFGRGGNREFLQFLYISRGSIYEVKSQIYVFLDNDYINQSAFDRVYRQASKAESLLNGLIKHLRSSDLRGAKFSVREPGEVFDQEILEPEPSNLRTFEPSNLRTFTK